MQEEFLCDDCRDIDLRCYSDNSLSVQFVPTNEECLLSSTANTEIEDIRILPNPAHNTLTLSGLNKTMEYVIYSLQGRLIQKGVTESNGQISIELLPDGLYIISFDNIDRNFKFVKQ
jgi:hypothetical protein